MLLEKRKERMVAIPTSSMADIAFLLLTFFLVTTSLDLDKGLGLQLPARGKQQVVHKRNLTLLFVNERGQVLLDNEIIEINTIKEKIRQMLIQNPLLIVSIKTSRRTRYQTYVHVLDQVQLAMGNAMRISIAEPET